MKPGGKRSKVMARRTKVLSGASARGYFQGMLTGDPGVTPAAADRLTETCAREIAELRVRKAALERRLKGEAAAVESVAVANEPVAVEAPVAVAVQVPEPTPEPVAPPTPAPEPPSAAPPFDPFAFSLVVVLRRSGKAGLLDRLRAEGDADRLRQIAQAQHIGIDSAGDTTDLEVLCAAIVAGTERRVAHREAAAS